MSAGPVATQIILVPFDAGSLSWSRETKAWLSALERDS
jgi:hypothetical protein